MAYNIEVNFSDDTHMKSGIFCAFFHDTIWNVIPILHCPFKDLWEVYLYSHKQLDMYLPLHTHTYIVITYIYLNLKTSKINFLLVYYLYF